MSGGEEPQPTPQAVPALPVLAGADEIDWGEAA
jgi:hypothetical protein